ncbi:CatB-related O-acetyltransferase [Lacrimispora amygdalina]|uniref:CatB-related O-acetyltransferase n=1 Tax=Lacrimispora amygdalina TaxID=253257 RepID=UPI001A9A5594|nr:CatB-related O-acetyltransferase [Lacrimispora amygdalina]
MRRLLVLIRNILSIPYRIFCTHIAVIAVLQEAVVDKNAAICSGVKFYRGKLGKYSYIGNNSFVTDTEIGNFTSISMNCYIGGTAHPTEWVSTSPVFHKWGNVMKKNFSRHEFEIFKRTIIGNDVWIGNRVMIKAGVSVGDGAVIGMGSIVTKDIGAYEIWAGNPAKMIRKRFDDEMISKLEEIKWWEWSDEKLFNYAEEFVSPKELFRSMEE